MSTPRVRSLLPASSSRRLSDPFALVSLSFENCEDELGNVRLWESGGVGSAENGINDIWKTFGP